MIEENRKIKVWDSYKQEVLVAKFHSVTNMCKNAVAYHLRKPTTFLTATYTVVPMALDVTILVLR